jgi:hypothetical protein
MPDAYSRLYHRLMTEYPSVWHSDAQLGLFVKLLITAEKFYPESAPIPGKTRTYHMLVACGLVQETGAGRYTIKGLQAERERRSGVGRNAAAVRWQSERNANALLDETRRDEHKNSNGQSPQAFMRFPPKAGSHMGQHPDCLVCAPLKETHGGQELP